MFYVSVCDILSIPVVGIADGVMAVRGDVYCSIPKTDHVLGLLASVFWYAESSAAVLLAANRCIDVAWSKVDKFLTTGNRTWVMLLAPTLYALGVTTFTRPVLFNAIYACWFYHPHVGYLDIPPEN
ncbi:Protein SRT-31, partial [Aphelenchoides avenae]